MTPSGMHSVSATDEEMRELFARLGPAQVRDASVDHTLVPDPMPQRRTPGLKLAGPVFPVATDNDMLSCIQALDAAPPGSVLYLHNLRQPSDALAGDILATAARSQGLAGLVVHGAVRDIDALPAIGLPVFSTDVRFVSAKTAIVPASAVPATIVTDTMVIRPGDWIVGDGDGVVVVEAAWVRPVLAAATLLQRSEEDLRAALNGGERFSELCGLEAFLEGKRPLRFNA